MYAFSPEILSIAYPSNTYSSTVSSNFGLNTNVLGTICVPKTPLGNDITPTSDFISL